MLLYAAQVYECPSSDKATGGVIQSMENISNFLQALQDLGFPQSAIFSIADIESRGWEDR